MKRRKQGYILLEIIASLFIIVMILTCLYNLISTCCISKVDIEDKIELNQQLDEMEYYIRDIVDSSINVISIKTSNNQVITNPEPGIVYDVASIKLNYKNEDNKNNTELKNKEISFKKSRKKLFINTLSKNNFTESGGYEIGDYVNIMKVKMTNSKTLSILLEVGKNDTVLEWEIVAFLKGK